MKKQKRLFSGHFYSLTIIFSMLLLVNCQKNELFDKAALDDYLQSLPPISSVMPEEKDPDSVSVETSSDSAYIYNTTNYEIAAGYSEQIVLNPQTDVIYPGALVRGESILDGTYTLIPALRKPITISTSLVGAPEVSIVVDDPKLSTVREAINKLMSNDFDVPPANMGFEMDQVYSEQQLTLSLKAGYKTGVMNIIGGFDFSKKEIKTRMVAKFIQNYYTLDMDMPSKPSDLFSGDVDRTLFGTFMPMYVASVTYGRIALFTIESELDETDVRAALDVKYGTVDMESEGKFNTFKSKSTMKVYILGGSGTQAGATVNGFDDFKNYIQTGGNFSKSSPGAPISYKLRYIKDNVIGKIVFSASYPIVTAIQRTDNIRYDIKTHFFQFKTKIKDPFSSSDCQLYGTITSYPESLGSGSGHKHFNYTSSSTYNMPAEGTRGFADTNPFSVEWNDLKQNDTITFRVVMAEKDDGSKDDKYQNLSFKNPVSTIFAGINSPENPGVMYYQFAGKVADTEKQGEYVEVIFRFTPVMRRLE